MKKPARRLDKLSFVKAPTALRSDDLAKVTGGGELDPCVRTIIPCIRVIVPCVRILR